MEIVQERLEREYDLDLIVTAPSVIYKVNLNQQEHIFIDNPSTIPDPQLRESIEAVSYTHLTLPTSIQV